MTMRNKIAAIFEDARNDGLDAFDAADAIIMALLDMIPDLVWETSHMTPWDGDYHSLPTAYTIRCADENGWKWSYNGGYGYSASPENAIRAANAHNRAAVCKALGVT